MTVSPRTRQQAMMRQLVNLSRSIWSVVLLSVLICGVIAWIHLRQSHTFNRATEVLISVREARIDLTKGFLYVSLARGPASPFQREEGMALIRQSLVSFRRSLRLVGSPATDRAFRRSLDTFQRRLATWQRTGGNQPAAEANLRIAFHDLEQKADALDLALEQHLRELAARQEREFFLALLVAAILLAAICLVVLRTEQARTRAEAIVREREATLRAIFESALNVAFVITDVNDAEAHVLEFSPGAERIFGYSREEMLGQPVGRLHLPEDVAHFPAAHEAMRTGKRGFFGERVLVRKNGQAFSALFSTYPLFDEQGTMYAALGVSVDISDLKRVEAQLRQASEELDHFFNLALDLLAIADMDGHFHRLNPAWEQTLGYTREELMAGYFLDFVHPDDLAKTRDALAQLAAQHRVVDLVLRFRCTDGAYRWIEWRSAPSGTRIYTAARDITDRLRAEEALRQSEQRFRGLFNAMTEGVLLYTIVRDEKGTPINYRVLDANPAVTRHTGISVEEAKGALATELFRTETPSNFDVFLAVAETGQPTTFETYYAPRQQYYTVSVFSPEPGIFATVFEDITARKRDEEARKAAEATLNSILQTVPAGIGILHKGVIQWTNDEYCRMIGYTKDELLGQHIRMVYPDDDEYARVAREVYSAMHRTGMGEAQVRYRRKDGTILDSLLRLRLRDPAQPEGEIVFALIDISAQKRTEAALRAKEFQLEESQRNAHIGTYVLDISARSWTDSAGLDDIFGITPDYPHTLDGWLQLVHPDEREMMARYFTDIAIPDRLFNKMYRIVRQNDGAVRWVLGLGKVTCDQEGTPCQMIGTVQDITERKQAEDTIHRERAFLASAIELMPFPVFFASTNQAIFLTNQACRAFLHEDGLDQWRAITLIDPNTHEPIASEDREVSRLFSGEPAPPREVTMIFPDGREMPALLFMAPIAVGTESVAAVIAFQDITVVKEADQAKNQFLQVISHELRTPLTSILGWTKLLQDAPDLLPEAVPIILQSAQQFEGLLERMIILSRILTGKLTARRETVDVCTLATEIAANYQPIAARKGVVLTWQSRAETLDMLGDAHLLRMAFAELVDNAINFTPAGGRVMLACQSRSDGTVALSVADTGRGIAAEELPNVMKPFSQFRREEAIGGIGIGLTLVQGIVHAHHGEVIVTSPGINQGTTVTLLLPQKA